MKKIEIVQGEGVPLNYDNIDTDQIAPSDAMKISKRINFKDFLFRDWREDEQFELNQPAYQNANVLVAGENFGCGSSREHAPWALIDYGFEAVIAPSFGDIFKNNSSKVGLLTIELASNVVQDLMNILKDDPKTIVSIDVGNQQVVFKNKKYKFNLDPYTKFKLLRGLDDVELSLLNEEKISNYEAKRPNYLINLSQRT